MKNAVGALALALCVSTVSGAALAEERGSWTLLPAEEAGEVHLTVMQRQARGMSHSGSHWPVSAFQGLDLATRERHDVTFSIVRDAGRFDCEGYLADGEGAGVFRFTPDPDFAAAMRGEGFSGIDEDEQFTMALHDVSLEFARQMKSENLAGLDTDNLVAFRIFGVSPEYISALQARGLKDLTAEKLIALRIHGID